MKMCAWLMRAVTWRSFNRTLGYRLTWQRCVYSVTRVQGTAARPCLYWSLFSFPFPLASSSDASFRKHDRSLLQIDLSESICWSSGAWRPLTSQTLGVELHALQPLPHFQPSKTLWMNVWEGEKNNIQPGWLSSSHWVLIGVMSGTFLFCICFLKNPVRGINALSGMRF